jgi:ankyrin repeat protein
VHRVGQPRFTCDFLNCAAKFKRKDNLLQHERTYHWSHSRSDGSASVIRLEGPATETPISSSRSNEDAETYLHHFSATTILQAASAGETSILKVAWRSGFDLTSTADDGCTVLHGAARAGQATTVAELLKLGCCSSTTNIYNRTPLQEAILSRDTETVATFLGHCKCTVDTRTLCIAVKHDQPAIMELLCKSLKGVQKVISIYKALRLAATLGRSVIIEVLLDFSATHVDEFVYRREESLLHVAATHGQAAIVPTLLSRDIALNRTITCGGYTALHLAVEKGHENIVGTLLAEESLSIDTLDYKQEAALHIAISKGHSSIAQLLLQDWRHAAACNNQKKAYFTSALIHAVAMQHTYEAQILLSELHQFDINIKHQCEVPVKSDFHRTPFTLLHAAAHSENIALMEALLARIDIESNIRARNPWGIDRGTDQGTPLHYAVQSGRLEATRLLLQLQDIDPNHQKFTGETPLHLAARHGQFEIAELLLSHKDVVPNAQDKFGETPLHEAANRGNLELVQSLLQHMVVKPNLQNAKGDMPLHCALLGDHLDTAKLLLAHGGLNISDGVPFQSQPTLQTKDFPDETVLQIARRKGQTEIIEILESRGDIGDTFSGYATPEYMELLQDDTAVDVNDFEGSVHDDLGFESVHDL